MCGTAKPGGCGILSSEILRHIIIANRRDRITTVGAVALRRLWQRLHDARAQLRKDVARQPARENNQTVNERARR